MKWTTTKMIKEVKHHFKCDFCEIETDDNRGCCGCRTIEGCWICGKHACRLHRNFFTEEEWEDRPRGFYCCQDCEEEAKAAWSEATVSAGRYEDILDVVKGCINDIRYVKNSDRKIKHVPFKWHWEK